MGWWHTSRKGESFVKDEAEYEWGDTPADILDSAVDGIRTQFRGALGREPLMGELRAGLEFTLMQHPDDTSASALDD